MEASCSGKRKRPLDDEDGDGTSEDEKIEQPEHEIAIEAQEPATIAQYDDIQVTPFNLEDELEEGDFDKAGNFIFKSKEELDETNNDTWAESIDWSRVKDSKIEIKEPSEEPEPEPAVDPVECYKQMLRIMKSDETIQKTIRRLGNSVPKRRPNKNKSKELDTPEVIEARKKLDTMISLAHKLLENGDMDVYQKSYEDLEEAING